MNYQSNTRIHPIASIRTGVWRPGRVEHESDHSNPKFQCDPTERLYKTNYLVTANLTKIAMVSLPAQYNLNPS